MKKQVKKLVLAKETLRTLETTLAHAVGGDTAGLDWCMGTMVCPPAPCPTGMYRSCAVES